MNPHTPKNTRKKRRVSVIIPGYGRKETLRTCLVSLSRQTLVPEEVIVTDNSGGSAVKVTVDSFRKKYPVRLRHVLVAKKGAGNARAAGVGAAKSPILVFIDDDCVPKRTWIAELVGKWEGRQNSVIQGRSENGLPGDLFASLNHFKDQQYLQSGMYRMLTKTFSPWFDAKNCLIPRDLFRKGALDFRDVELEDLDLSVQIINQGIPVAYASRAVVFHFGRSSFSASFLRWVRMGVGRYLLRVKLRSSGTHFYRSRALNEKIRTREERIRNALLAGAFDAKSPVYRIAFHVLYRLSITVTNMSYLLARVIRP